MSSRKVESSSDSDSGPEDLQRTEKKKGKKRANEGDGEKASAKKQKGTSADPNVFHLDNKKRISLSQFRGQTRVDMREYYEADGGEMKPTKKGISITLDQWEKLKALIPEIDEAIKDL